MAYLTLPKFPKTLYMKKEINSNDNSRMGLFISIFFYVEHWYLQFHFISTKNMTYN